jgi:hypothetical protein
MQKRKKLIPPLIIAILSLLGTILLIITFNPTRQIDLSFIKLSPIIPFFLCVFLSIAGILGFTLNNLRRGIFIALFTVVFLLLQMMRYNNIFYTALLIIIFVLLELLFWKKK